MKKILALALVLCMALSLCACGGSSEPTTSAPAGDSNAPAVAEPTNVTVQIGPNPETLDPALNSASDGGNMILHLFENLLIIDENLNLAPGQAESYTVSPDGLVWTFTMRDGLKYSDGSELNAKDYEYAFKRVVDPATAAPYGETVLGMVEGYADVVATGDVDKLAVVASEDGKTLTITLSYPCTYFGQLIAFATLAPVNEETVAANGDAWAVAPETYVCNGPYMISEWTPGERIVLAKNPNYNGGWDESKIVTDTLTFLLLEDSSASYAAYTSGEAKLIKDVPTEEIPSFTKAEDGGDFYVDPILGTYYLNMNVTKAPFDNVLVRKALNLAIDREYVANVVMQGTYAPAYNFVGTNVADAEGWFIDNAVAANGGNTYISKDYEANLEAAKAALAEAGYPNGEGFPVITYSTNDSGYHVAVAEYLQACYKELGITMNIDKVEWASFTPMRRAGDYEMARNGWVMDYNDASNLLDLMYSTNGNNDGKYANPEFDAAMDAAKTADLKAHSEALHNAEAIAAADYAVIPVAYYTDFWLQSADLQGTWHSPYGYWYLMYAYLG
ncbi:MAG: peptide ABC transporter substrate-binding protein [Oscillospiraceae bacterium]|nr:peptide ABC transporter substrate-binding protein [Oscillospiraceae bacterium]